MSIEVDVPIEIEDYKEKIIFGMSLRQLICTSVAVVLSIGTYFLCTKAIGMTMDATSYVIILESLPLMALGFIRKDGQPFEKYLALFLRQKIGDKKLPYVVKVVLQEEVPQGERKSKYAWVFEKEDSGTSKSDLNKRERAEKLKRREAVIFQTDATNRKRKSKETRAKIKTAQKEYRAAKRRYEEESKERSRAQKLG